MNLRSKFLYLICGFLLFQAGIFFAFHQWVALPRIEALEANEARNNTYRGQSLLHESLLNLVESSQQWLANPALQQYFATEPPTSEAVQPLTQQLLQRDQQLLFLLGPEQQDWGIALDPNTQQPLLMPNFILQLTASSPKFLEFTAEQSINRGIFLTERGPILLVARPLVAAPTPTTLLIGKFITTELLAQLSGLSRTELNLWPQGVKVLPPRQQNILKLIDEAPNHIHIEKNDNTLQAYTQLKDLSQTSAMVLASTTPRNTWLLFKNNLKESYATLLVANVLMIIILLNILNHSIIFPAQRLIKHLYSVKAKIHSQAPTITIKNQDEIGSLYPALNGLLHKLYEHQHKTTARAYHAGKQHMREELLRTTHQVLDPFLKDSHEAEKKFSQLSLNTLEQVIAQLASDPKLSATAEHSVTELQTHYTQLRQQLKKIQLNLQDLKMRSIRISTTLKTYGIHLDRAPIWNNPKSK
jgi:sensor domain CHASE-containing protein